MAEAARSPSFVGWEAAVIEMMLAEFRLVLAAEGHQGDGHKLASWKPWGEAPERGPAAVCSCGHVAYAHPATVVALKHSNATVGDVSVSCSRCGHHRLDHYNSRRAVGKKPCHHMGKHDMRCLCVDFKNGDKKRTVI